MKPPSLTIGIEEEYQIIDPETRELRSYITEMLDRAISHARARSSRSCTSRSSRSAPRSAARPPRRARSWCGCAALVMDLAAQERLVIAAAGTHPFSSWMEQEITPLERYIGVQGRPAGPRAAAADLRHARAHRHRGPRLPDRRDERRALLPAARARALHELAVLDGPQHRPQVVPQHRLPQLPAHRHPARSFASWADYQRICRHARAHRLRSPTASRSGGTCGPITAIRRSSSASATSARGWTRRSASPRFSRRLSPSSGSCAATT